jgi:transcriptional regulator with XRE-family HTH domain
MKEASFCPICGSDDIVKVKNGSDIIKIKNEEFEVITNYMKCYSCNEKFYLPKDKLIAIEQARREYRKKYFIPSPDDIMSFMKKYKISLRDMEKLTGIAFKTIDRYLRGAIPNQSNANLLRMFFHYPEVLLDTVLNSETLPEKKILNLVEILKDEVSLESVLKCTHIFKEKLISLKSEDFSIKYNDREDPWKVINEGEETIDNPEYKYAC